MLKIIEGNLFDYAKGACVIAHGVNLQGYMGAGFALEMQNRFPYNFVEYRQMCYNLRVKVGDWLVVHEDEKAIFNLFTQETFGREQGVVYVDYAAVEKGLKSAAWYSRTYDMPLHFPYIGAGLAGGDAEKLKKIFEEVCIDTNAVLYIQPVSKKVKKWRPSPKM